MTVATEAYFGQLLWNNEAQFNPGFSVERTADVRGMATSPSLVDTVLNQGTQFHVLIGANGAVTIAIDGNVMPPAPQLLTFWRDTNAVQGVDFQDLEDFSADDHELLHDRWARTLGELKGDLLRAPLVPLGETLNPLPIFHTRKGTGQGTVFTFDGTNGQTLLVNREDFLVPDGSITTIKLADGAVTTPKLADQAVTNDKIHDADLAQEGINLRTKAQWAQPFNALWGTNGAGVTDLFTAGQGISINGLALKVEIPNLGITTGMLADDAVTADKIADNSIVNSNIGDHAIDLPTKAAGATPDRLWGVDSSGLTRTYKAGPGLRIFHATPSESQIEIGPSYITEDFIAGGAIITGHIAPAQIINSHIRGNTIDLVAKSAGSTPDRLFGTVTSGAFAMITVGAGLSLVNGLLSAAGAGTGSVNTQGPVTSAMLTGYADSTGNLIKGVTVGAGLNYTAGALTAVLGAGGAQPFDDDLTAIAALGGSNNIYYRAGAGAWLPVAIGANLTFVGGTLSATAGGGIGTGNVNTSGSVNSNQLTGYADSTGNLIKGVNVGGGLSYNGTALAVAFGAGGAQPYDPELAALASVTSAADTLPYFQGAQSANVTPLTAFARSLLDDADAATARATLGIDLATLQPLDDDLTAIAALTGTDVIYYRSGAGAWSAVAIGSNLTFTGGTLSATGGGGGGTVNTSGTVSASMLTGYADGSGNLIKGVNVGAALTYNGTTLDARLGSGGAQAFDAELAAIAGLTSAANQLPYFTGAGAAALTTLSAFGRTLIDDADAATARTTLGIDLSAFQPIDPDLTSLAGASGTNAIYYRRVANTWDPVTIGANLSFSNGVLSATTGSGGGDAFLANNQTWSGTNIYTGASVFGVVVSAPHPTATFAVQLVNLSEMHSHWTNDAVGPVRNFAKARGGAIGVQAAVALDDQLGNIQFMGSDGTQFLTAAQVRAYVDGTPAGSSMPGRLEVLTRPGAAAVTRRMTVTKDGIVLIGPNSASPAGVVNLLQVDGTGGAGGAVHFARWANDATPMTVNLRKSRGAVGVHSNMLANDVLGSVDFIGSDGTGFVTGAQVQAYAAAASPGTGKLETGLKFWTRSNDGVLFERMRIWPSGCVQIGLGTPLDVGGGAIEANAFAVKQAADVPSQGFALQNAAATAQSYIFLGSAPTADLKIMHGPGPINFYNTADQANPIAVIHATGCAFKGTNSTGDAAAGFIGEYATPVTFTNFSISSGQTLNVANISLTAGDWDVWAQVTAQNASGGSGTSYGLTTTSGTVPSATVGQGQTTAVAPAGTAGLFSRFRFSLASTQPVYFVANSTTNVLNFTGAIFARRVR